ncbi:MAG: UDP-N-acetylglucosamine 2-epimerase [Candidatus Margulisbacteria bacterium GWF2_38_17]|nr:MAG: UDP-N-acetylglucosamine 2-epimerase [Candidatus Margulisbacteria bacterium GWF2_38_17]OGI09592.1 MAG: UDP-N-acetylglucosamine 2-epimerase [Candidatus Margulisbacteria bacterium GWE2_39_32]
MMKLLFVFGTRPEAIKMAPVIIELKKYPEIFDVKVCVTAQHRQMLDQVMNWFHIAPDYDLNIMKPGQDLYDITANVLVEMKSVLRESAPDLILVQGDTTTVMAASIAAFYTQIPIAHIEAGLRTNNLLSPFPEEFNRRVTSIITKYHFAPTKTACQNLLDERVFNDDIYVTGNTVIDALMLSMEKIKGNLGKYYKLPQFKDIDFSKQLVLITAHRRENFGQEFKNMCGGIKSLANTYPDIEFVYPVHLNPNVQTPVNEILTGIPNIKLITPLDYENFVFMMSKSRIVLTDSGGVQEEAPSLGKPVLVMRNNTERPEAVTAGTVKLVGTDNNKIFNEVSKLIDDPVYYQKMSTAVNPYGDGNASSRIKAILAGEQFVEFGNN